MSSVTLYLRGDQIGTYDWLHGEGNNQDRVVTLNGVHAVGDRDQVYKVLVEQVNSGTTEFQNGQFVTITDADGNIVMPRTGARPDEEQGLASGDEHLVFTGTHFVIDLAGLSDTPSVKTYTHGQDDAADAETGDNDGNLDFNDFPCLARGTLVMTESGPRPVEALRPGDRLRAEDGAWRRVIWTASRTLALSAAPDRARPVRIAAGSLGPGQPGRDLVVSPQHRIALSIPAGGDRPAGPALVPARALLELPGIRQMAGRRHIEYVALLLDRHAVIEAEGLAVESLYPGPQALRSLGPRLAAELSALIPGLESTGAAAYGPPARPLLTMREARGLVRALDGKTRLRPETGAAA